MKQRFLALIWFFFVTAPVYASDAWQAFVAGDYDTATKLGRQENTATSLTVACRSNLVIGGFLTEDKTATDYLHAAIKDCLHAVQLNNTHFDAQMSLAIALSFEGKRTKSIFYPKTARLMLEKLVKKHPDNALAYGALAAWHSQVSAAGFFARITLKASRKKAEHFFNEAFSHGVIDFPLRMEHLKFLATGSKQSRKQALKVAEELVALPLSLEFDRFLQQRCIELLNALRTGKKRHIKKAIKTIAAFSHAENWQDADTFPKVKIPEF